MWADTPAVVAWAAALLAAGLLALWLRQRRQGVEAARREQEMEQLSAELGVARERLQLALDAVEAGTWHWNLSTDEVRWDANNAQLFGMSLDEFRGDRAHVAEAVHPADMRAAEAQADWVVEHPGSMLDVTLRLREGDRVVRVHGKVLRDDDGNAVAMTGLCHDVTRAQDAQRALADSEERLRATFEQAAVGIAHLSPEGNWLRMNQKVCEIMGYSAEELRRTSFQKLTHPADLESDLEYVRELIAGERDRYQMEKRYIHKEGFVVWGSLSVSLVRELDGTPKYFISVIEDISERKALESQLIEAKRELERRVEERTAELSRSNADLEQFAYVASHDLQEPLRMVTSYLELIERRYAERFEGEAREFMDFAVGGARRMKLLIDDLLHYSRLGTRPEERREVDLNEVVDAACANLSVTIQETGAQLDVDELPTLRGQPGRLTSLFQNLLDNAMKYRGDAPPRISVSAERDADAWRIDVRDNGIGVDERHTDRIFEIFQRLHRDAEIPGTGIGLASAKKIVEAHGGRIWLASRPGGGSTVSFRLPSTPERTQHEPSADPSLVGGGQPG